MTLKIYNDKRRKKKQQPVDDTIGDINFSYEYCIEYACGIVGALISITYRCTDQHHSVEWRTENTHTIHALHSIATHIGRLCGGHTINNINNIAE